MASTYEQLLSIEGTNAWTTNGPYKQILDNQDQMWASIQRAQNEKQFMAVLVIAAFLTLAVLAVVFLRRIAKQTKHKPEAPGSPA